MPNGDAEALLTYEEVLAALPDRKHLLLGNGFSIACDPVFRYDSLYDHAVAAGLSERAQAVFERLGENNFEGAMSLLEDARWVGQQYGLGDDGERAMLDDVQHLKRALIEAIGESHLSHSGEVPNEKKEAALDFLNPYHNVFTVNYDLLLYWVTMFREPHPFEDGFRADPDDQDTPYVIFQERMGRRPGLYFIHGALHLYRAAGELRKHTWIRTGEPLIDQIRDSLAAGQYPVFVAEGSADNKLAQIRGDAYLSYCLGKLGRIRNPLVILGHSLRAADRHILETIAANRHLETVYVGLYGDPGSRGNRAIRAAADDMVARRAEFFPRRELDVCYFDSATANVWGEAVDAGRPPADGEP